MRYYLIAGEASGDLHGSNLIKGLKAEDKGAEFRFWGGDMMCEAALQQDSPLVRHYREGAVMGLTDVLAKAGKLIANIKYCEEDILAWQPDVVILIDYPGFNMKIAKFCRQNGIKVFYYIAPKTWASRERRNAGLKEWVDKLFIVFPFEVPYFSERGIPFEYVGNPLLDAVDGHRYLRPVEGRYIAVLAGSRKGEISRMMPVCAEVIRQMHSMPGFEGYEFVIAGAPSRSESDYLPYLDAGMKDYVRLVFNRTYDVLKFAEAAIINSGTASLEAALIGTPQVVCWSTSALSAFVGRHILKVLDHIKYISLGNLCVDRPVFRELLQEDFNPDNVREELVRLVTDEGYRSEMVSGYQEIRESLGGAGASRAVAKAMISSL